MGTGSGYGAAVLSRLCREVVTIERYESLAVRAEQALHELGYDNVVVGVGDGCLGAPERRARSGASRSPRPRTTSRPPPCSSSSSRAPRSSARWTAAAASS